MLRITHGVDKIEIKFDHKLCSPDEIEGLTGVCVDSERRCTVVTTSLNGHVVGRGMAVCNPCDNFCRSTGRKKAMAYALQPLSKEIRTAVWTEYQVAIGL